MAKAEQAILAECEDALQATVIVDKLKQLRDQAVELKRQGKMDASSVQGEVDKVKAEIARLVDLAAKGGSLDEVHAGIRDRKARLEHAEGKLLMVSGKAFDYAEVRDQVQEVLKDWKSHLRKPAARFTGPANFEGLLEDAGVDLKSMRALLDEIVPPRRRGSKTSNTLTSAGCPRPSSPSRSRRRRCRPSRWWTRCSHGSTR